MQMICHGLSTGALFILVGHAPGPPAHARHGPHGRPVGGRAADGRRGHVLRPGLAGPAGAGQLRRRVPGAARRLPGQHPAWRPSRRPGWWSATVYSLVDDPTQSSTAQPREDAGKPADLRRREIGDPGVLMALVLVWLGLYPQPVLDTAKRRSADMTLHGNPEPQTSSDRRTAPRRPRADRRPSTGAATEPSTGGVP